MKKTNYQPPRIQTRILSYGQMLCASPVSNQDLSDVVFYEEE